MTIYGHDIENTVFPLLGELYDFGHIQCGERSLGSRQPVPLAIGAWFPQPQIPIQSLQANSPKLYGTICFLNYLVELVKEWLKIVNQYLEMVINNIIGESMTFWKIQFFLQIP